MDTYAAGMGDYSTYVGFSNLPAETSSGDFWASIISTLSGAGIAAYQISQGAPVSTTQTSGGTTVTTGPAAQVQTNTLLILGAIVIIALLVFSKK
jgi:phosphate/sulfate permease